MTFEYLALDDVLNIHRAQIERYGGISGARDLGLIEAALMRPQSGYYTSLLEQAAALWESLAMNHGFVDGNKRIAFASAQIFLRMNGFSINAGQPAIIDFIYTHLELGSFRKDVIEAWLQENIMKRPTE
jgi:death on curing protein